MTSKREIYQGFAFSLCCCAIAWQLIFILVIFLGNIYEIEDLDIEINDIIAHRNAIPDSLIKSWTTEPFTDVIVIDIADPTVSLESADCPDTHPHDVIYEIWPGSRHFCDCLERADNRELYPDL